MERIPSAQPPPCLQPKHPLDIADMQGMEYPMYVYKPRRGVKRGDDKETYKLPHRLIEKKRRDRINECIAQLKDLLPEHLKLTTLGHLEKAVVLELTLKHVKALSSLLDQQQQKIVALQSGAMICEQEDDGAESEEMFRSGFHLCAKEVLRYLADRESGGDLTPSHVMGHIHKVASEVLHHPAAVPRPPDSPAARGPSAGEPEKGHAMNCVPVIQRTSRHGAGEQSGSDTDTDSGYGGEHEKTQRAADCCGGEGEPKQAAASPVKATGAIKREGDEPEAKRPRSGSPEEADRLSAPSTGAPGSFVSFSPNQPPFCMPFYLIPSAAAAAAAYLPMLEKCWYSGGMPVMYPPGMGAHAAGYPSDALSSSLAMASRAASPGQHHHQNLVESPALLQALKQIPPLNMETKD